ncbi:MAG: hypothetical protein JXQ93_02280 [Flavobacteriaceae bacterium]
MNSTVKEEYKAFMIMPFLSDKQKEELRKKGEDHITQDIRKRKLCEDFYNEIISKVCDDLKNIKLEIKRADEINKQKIDDAILQGIKESDVFIVDLTLVSPNVMYELGMTHHIDIQRTLIITQDDTDSLPFDIKGIRVKKYDSTEAKWLNIIEQEIYKLIERFKSTELCIGISEYPELMILEKKLNGVLRDIKIKNVAWDKTFEEISKRDKRVDLVIANRDKFDSENRPVTKYIYSNQLVAYNSFSIIHKGFEIESFDEVYKRTKNKRNSIIKTLKQIPENTIVFVNGNTDHYNSFIKVNKLFGEELIKKPLIRGASDELDGVLKDFIDEDEPSLFVGGIPERINLLKNEKYRILIEHKNLRDQQEFKKIKQENGIVFHRSKYLDKDDIDKWANNIQELYRNVYSEIQELIDDENFNGIDQYLETYNNSDRVKQFSHKGIKLHITAQDYAKTYLGKRLIYLPKWK